MKTEKVISRRNFITTAGAALTCASAGLLSACAGTENLAADPVTAQEVSDLQFSMYLYTLMNAPLAKQDFNIAEICSRTKAMGIDGLDWIGSGYNQSWEQIRKIVDDHGMRTICFTMGVGEMESPDAAERAIGLDEFKNRLETAHILGANRIMLNQGGKRSGNSSAINRQWMIESLGEAMPLAADAGIEVTIETHNSKVAPFRNSSHFNEALAQVPELRVCFDTGNSFANGEDPLQGYLNNKEHVTHMHFKDFGQGTLGNKQGSPCVPGTGLIDYASIIHAMKANGYKGYINLEKGGPDGFEVYRESMAILAPLVHS